MPKDLFWRLDSPSNDRKLAEWDPTVEQQSVVCSAHPGHQRAGRRLGPLRVVLPSDIRDDVIWTWYSECLVQESVLKLLAREGITGYSTREVRVERKSGAGGLPPLSELVVTGWGGVARPSSGIRLDPTRSCPSCNLLVYTGLTNPAELFDPKQWDGSDVFMIWPLPRFILVSARLARLLRAEEVTGTRLTPLEHLPPTSSTLSPGRLSYWMPEERARELGEPLGIR